MDEWKRDGSIPAFGNWDLTSEFPITRYFECASKTHLQVRCSSSSAQTAHHRPYSVQPRPTRNLLKQETRNRHGIKGKVYYDIREQAIRKSNKHLQVQQQHDTVPRTPKPVEEDLYKIPPELLHATNKRRKMPGFISKCLILFVCHERC